jgi:hypothetical protein
MHSDNAPKLRISCENSAGEIFVVRVSEYDEDLFIFEYFVRGQGWHREGHDDVNTAIARMNEVWHQREMVPA